MDNHEAGLTTSERWFATQWEKDNKLRDAYNRCVHQWSGDPRDFNALKAAITAAIASAEGDQVQVQHGI